MLACCCVTLPSAPRTELGTPFPLETFLEDLSPGFTTLNGRGSDDNEDEGSGPGSSKKPMSSVSPDPVSWIVYSEAGVTSAATKSSSWITFMVLPLFLTRLG